MGVLWTENRKQNRGLKINYAEGFSCQRSTWHQNDLACLPSSFHPLTPARAIEDPEALLKLVLLPPNFRVVPTRLHCDLQEHF